MHRELKLQHALLQQIAQKVGVDEQASTEMRKLVAEAPEGASVAALLRTPPLTRDYGGSPQLTVATATTATNADSTPGASAANAEEKATV